MVDGRVTAISASRRASRHRVERTLVIGSTTAALPAGRSVQVAVHLNATGARLLQRQGKLAVLVEVKAQSEVIAKSVLHLRVGLGRRH